MDAHSEQIAKLTQLLSLSTRSLTHLTAAIATLSFEMMRSEDRATKAAEMAVACPLPCSPAGRATMWSSLRKPRARVVQPQRPRFGIGCQTTRRCAMRAWPILSLIICAMSRASPVQIPMILHYPSSV